MLQNPRKTNNFKAVAHQASGAQSGNQSDGELKVDKLSEEQMLTYGGRPRPGVTQITKAAEKGEVTTNTVSSLQIKQLIDDKSEGEIDNPGLTLQIKHQEMLISYEQSIKSELKRESSEKKPSLKSKLKIESIRKI